MNTTPTPEFLRAQIGALVGQYANLALAPQPF